MRKTTLALTFICAIILFSCRETDTVQPNFPPEANAGKDRNIESGATVTIDAGESADANKDSLFYTWSFIRQPSNSQAVIEDADARATRFTADTEGEYVIRLTVTDLIDSDSDTLTVIAFKSNKPPVAIISNVPDGIGPGESFELQGGTSSDPDGDQLLYSWTIVNSPEGSLIAPETPNGVNSTFTTDLPGVYTIRLSVSDGTLSDETESTFETNVHTISDINPQQGVFGSNIKINGTNFSPVAEGNTVTVNGMPAEVTSASYTSLVVVIPLGAGTGPVAVTVGDHTVQGPVFTYELSYIVSTVAEFEGPILMAADGKGNIYISDYDSHIIRRLSSGGQLTTFAGNGKAGWTDSKNPLQAEFRNPAGLVVGADGSLYVADHGNHVIRKILSSGEVMTVAGVGQAGFGDGPAMQAVFNHPVSVALDHNNSLYIGDADNHRIRMMTSQGDVYTFAGNGQAWFADGYGQSAQFNGIGGINFSGGYLYVADILNQRIRRIDGQGLVSTYAGQGTSGFQNGSAATARFNFPNDVAVDANGGVVVADYGNHAIRYINGNGGVTTLAGTGVSGMVDGPAATARFNSPTGVCVSGDIIYVADFGNGRVRKIELK